MLVSAQDGSTFYKNQIKISPFRIIDFGNTGIEISYERMHSEKFSTQLSYSFGKDIFGMFPFDNFRGYRFSVEEKYFFESTDKYRKYFFESTDKYRKYISVDLFWNNNKYVDETPYRDSIGDYSKKEKFLIRRKIFSANLKYGKQVLFNHFIIDMCIGAGIRWRNITLYNVHPIYRSKGIDLMYGLHNPGKMVTFNLPMNIKIGYVF
jgi:hypothetical protein